jgi:hypothetical protein
MATVVGFGLVSTGVVEQPKVKIIGGGIGVGFNQSNIVNEQFIYDGVNNIFPLSNTALKVLSINIDNGSYPEYVPIGAVNNVTIEQIILLEDNRINIQYIKA